MKLKKQMIIVSMIIILYWLLQPSCVSAAFQANGGTPALKTLNDWIALVRIMQVAGGALGLTDELTYDANVTGGNNWTSNNKNLDIHMEKNTEYGALALLSASSYGNPNIIANGETTTGNKTGVYMYINGERVAAGTSNTKATYMYTAAKRYWDDYGSNTYNKGNVGYLTYETKIGDAAGDNVGLWHNASNVSWMYAEGGGYISGTQQPGDAAVPRVGLRRASSGSIFSHNGYGFSWRSTGDVHFIPQYSAIETIAPTRAVVVVGTGI